MILTDNRAGIGKSLNLFSTLITSEILPEYSQLKEAKTSLLLAKIPITVLMWPEMYGH